nr:XkdX family protein [Clostridioides sp.]
MWFDTVNDYYSKGYYTNEDIGIFVIAKMITETEYKEITSEDYTK